MARRGHGEFDSRAVRGAPPSALMPLCSGFDVIDLVHLHPMCGRRCTSALFDHDSRLNVPLSTIMLRANPIRPAQPRSGSPGLERARHDHRFCLRQRAVASPCRNRIRRRAAPGGLDRSRERVPGGSRPHQAGDRPAVPSEADVSEIETSSRLATRDGALYLTMPLIRFDDDGPRGVSAGFVLSPDRLITVRFAPSRIFDSYADHLPARCHDRRSRRAYIRRPDGSDRRPPGRRA